MCNANVNDGASMVRGIQRTRRCNGIVVFGGFCAAHAKGMEGYAPAPKAEKKSWRIFHTTPEGKKTTSFVWSAINERGASSSFKRNNPGHTIDGIVPNQADAVFAASEEAAKWAAWM